MAKNHPLMKDVKNWILDSFSFMDGVGYDILFDDDIYGMENTKAISADIDGLTDFDFEKGKKNLLKSISNKIKTEFPYLRITSGKDGHYFIMHIVLLDNNDYLEDKNIQYINLNESKESIRESYDYDDIKNETPIIDVWGNSEGTHVYEVFKINSDYVYYEYNYRKHDSTMITDVNEIEVIIRLMDYLPTKFIVKQEDKIGMLESAIANIKAINKHYGKLKKYNSNYYWQAVRFIKNSMLKDDNPDASNYFDEADDVINDALEQNGDSFRV